MGGANGNQTTDEFAYDPYRSVQYPVTRHYKPLPMSSTLAQATREKCLSRNGDSAAAGKLGDQQS